jgi:hypothetical protein
MNELLVPSVISVIFRGRLLRRQAPWHAVLFRYFEISFPMTVLLGFIFDASLAASYFNIPFQIWYLPLVGLLLGLTSTMRGWPWPLRLLLHVGWLYCTGVLVVRWLT